MFFRKNNKTEEIDFKSMTPIEAVTYLFVYVMLSDNQSSYEEKESWKESIQKLFPDHLESRTENFFSEAFVKINQFEKNKKELLLDKICDSVNNILDRDKVQKLGPLINNLIESDGIAMSSEINTVEIIKKNLNIDLGPENYG